MEHENKFIFSCKKPLIAKLYIDESKHVKYNFVLAAILFTTSDLSRFINEAYTDAGFDPKVFEFKSCLKMKNNLNIQHLRENLLKILRECRIGLAIAPYEKALGVNILKCINKIISVYPNFNYQIFLDEGLIKSQTQLNKMLAFLFKENWNDKIEFYIKENSHINLPIQLADLAAHTCSTILKSKLGFNKFVKAGKRTGYDPEMLIDLDFKLKAILRYNFFVSGKYTEDLTFKMSALEVDDACNSNVKKAARQAFENIYLGCIH